MKITRLTIIVQREPVFPCVTMTKGGLATAQTARKHASYTDI